MTARPAARCAASSSLVGFCAAASYAAATVPTLPIHARALGASDPEIGFLIAAGLIIAVAVGQTGFAHTATARRRAAIFGALLLAFTPLAFAVASDALHLLVLRLAQGLGLALLPSFALSSQVEAAASWRYGGRAGAAALLGWLIGPPAAGSAIEAAGTAAAFPLAAAFGLVAASCLLAIRKDDLPAEEDCRPPLPGRAIAAPIALGLAYAATGVFLPLYALDLGLRALQIGVLFAVVAGWMAAAVTFAVRATTASPGMLTVIGLLLSAIGTAAVAVGPRFPVLILGMAALGLGAAAVCLARWPSAAVGPRAHLTAADLASRTAHAVGPLLAGLTAPLLGSAALFLLAAIILATAAVLVAALAPGAAFGGERYVDRHRAGMGEAKVGVPGSEGRL